MHGDGAKSSNLAWVMVGNQFKQNGYDFLSISMPGYGESTG